MKIISSRQIVLPSILFLVGTYVVGATVSNAFAFDPFENKLLLDSKKSKLPQLVVVQRTGPVITVGPLGIDDSQVSCNEGETLTGGGFTSLGDAVVNKNLNIINENVGSGGQLIVIGAHIGPVGSDPVKFEALAFCAHLE